MYYTYKEKNPSNGNGILVDNTKEKISYTRQTTNTSSYKISVTHWTTKFRASRSFSRYTQLLET